MKKKFQLPLSLITPLLIFWTVFLVHSFSPVQVLFDSRWTTHVSYSLIKEGNLDLDEYRLELQVSEFFSERVNGHFYNVYPVGASLLAVPFVYIFDLVGVDVIKEVKAVQVIISSALIAFTATVLYAIARLSLNQRYSILLVFIFAFCTSTWSEVSRALWQHSPSMLMLSLALYLILLTRQKPQLIQFVSLPLAFAYISRPTNSVAVLLLTVLVFMQYWRYFLQYILWALPVAIPFLVYNYLTYHKLLSNYYSGGYGSGFGVVGLDERLIGNLISPSRGLFIFAPVLLFSVWGMIIRLRQTPSDPLNFFLIAIILMQWVTISLWLMWWAGHSYGPRIFSDVLPYFIYFLIPVFERLPKLKGARKIVFVTTFAVFLSLSFLINLRGAIDWKVRDWNDYPADVDQYPARLWDWSDPQFLRGF